MPRPPLGYRRVPDRGHSQVVSWREFPIFRVLASGGTQAQPDGVLLSFDRSKLASIGGLFNVKLIWLRGKGLSPLRVEIGESGRAARPFLWVVIIGELRHDITKFE